MSEKGHRCNLLFGASLILKDFSEFREVSTKEFAEHECQRQESGWCFTNSELEAFAREVFLAVRKEVPDYRDVTEQRLILQYPMFDDYWKSRGSK